MRAALTMLGIIIGVGSIITMLSLGAAASQAVADQISKIGSNLLVVFPGSISSQGVKTGAGGKQNLTSDDAEAIRENCPAVLEDAPILSDKAQVVYGDQNWFTEVTGTTPGLLTVSNWPISEGDRFTYEDVQNAAKVCVLGQTVVNKLFGGMDPIGQLVRIEKVPFAVIGVLARKGMSLSGPDRDDVVLVPITAAQERLFHTTFPHMVNMIMVKATGPEDLDTAQQQIIELLRQRHRIAPGKEDDFTVKNLTQMLNAAQKSASIMSLFLAAIASISLIVGGVGIMNIMLVSVTERTREIGIRMAVGAKAWDIRLQFLMEALTISLMGGIAGIVVGALASRILSVLSGWETLISPFSVILAVSFSVIVGIFFGFYPAYKASLLNPIDALRYE